MYSFYHFISVSYGLFNQFRQIISFSEQQRRGEFPYMVIIRTLVCFQQQTVGRTMGSPFLCQFRSGNRKSGETFSDAPKRSGLL